MRTPLLNMLSHNRFVFAASFTILAMAAVGLQRLYEGKVLRRWWFFLPATVLAGLTLFMLSWTAELPEHLRTLLGQAIEQGRIPTRAELDRIQGSFVGIYLFAAALGGLGLAGWLLLWFRPHLQRWFVPALGTIMAAELISFGYGRSAQCDWSLYYPPIPVLEQVAEATQSAHGRVIGYGCLPPALAQIQGLSDVRGYDAVEPTRFVQLVLRAAASNSPRMAYALTQGMMPQVLAVEPPSALRLHPILDMLGVEYVIFRGRPGKDLKPEFVGNDYWALRNPSALPRAFVPRRLQVIVDDASRLEKLADRSFDPRQVAYLEQPAATSLPAECLGAAEVTQETPRGSG